MDHPSSNATNSQTAAPAATLQAGGPRARRGETALWNDSQQRHHREQGALHETDSRTYPHGGVPVVEHCRTVTGCLGVPAVKRDEWKARRGPNWGDGGTRAAAVKSGRPRTASTLSAHGDSAERAGTPRALLPRPARASAVSCPASDAAPTTAMPLSRQADTSEGASDPWTGHGPMRSRSTTVRRRREHVGRGKRNRATHTSALLPYVHAVQRCCRERSSARTLALLPVGLGGKQARRC